MIRVSSKEEAWMIADRLFPTDYAKLENLSEKTVQTIRIIDNVLEVVLKQSAADDTIKAKNVEVTDLDKDLQDSIVRFTDGEYKGICDYSQYITDKNAMGYSSTEWFEENILPTISDTDKAAATQLMDAISSQNVSQSPLFRLEGGVNPSQEGDIIHFGIRSATHDADFADKVFNQSMEGFDFEDKNFNGNWTEYRFTSSKSLDISEISKYKEQEEELIAGSYRVSKVETIENIKPHWEEKTVQMKDVAENVEEFTAKSGKAMVRYTYDGVQHSDTVEKFNSRTVSLGSKYVRQFGRKIIWLEVE